jgi:hypothetical protein
MRKFISIITLALFILWIAPLGTFIRPEQEKKACNGRRAICLCTHLLKKQMAKMAGKQYLKSRGNDNKEQNSSSPSGPDYIYTLKTRDFKLAKDQYFQSTSNLIDQFVTRPIEHVPKV